MSSLDNLHRTNNGSHSYLCLKPQPMEYSATGNAWLKKNVNQNGEVDRIHRPLTNKTQDPFSRALLGRDIPGQEILQNASGYVPLGKQPTINPGGNAESWVLFQNTQRLR